MSIVAVTSGESRQVVHDLLVGQLGSSVSDHLLSGLSDADLERIGAAFPQLANLLRQAKPRALLRRLIVIDLLVRSEVVALPLSDLDVMREVWNGLVRRREQSDHGWPDAREQVLLRLADQELSRTNSAQVALSLDPAAVAGLRQDGLLRMSTDNPWQVLPEFSHEELRRFAVARVLLADGDPATALGAVGCPRWALSAGRLACQALLISSGSHPRPSIFGKVQAGFDALASAYGARWGDVPGEALLTLGDPGPLLAEAWPELHDDDGNGLKRLLRLAFQRHRENGIIDSVVVEPIVSLLLTEQTPWWAGDNVVTLLREWLQALVVRRTPVGNALRIRLREQLVAACRVPLITQMRPAMIRLKPATRGG